LLLQRLASDAQQRLKAETLALQQVVIGRCCCRRRCCC
jgi:hypothetical protein